MADFLNIDQVLTNLDIKQDMSAVEFGCGSADFALALAKKLTKGKVYAIDIQEEKLSVLKSKAASRKLNNISTLLCDLETLGGSTLADNSQDIIVIPNMLFQVENKSVTIKEAKRILKSGGQLLVMDWVANAPFGPKQGVVNPEELKKIATEIGFSLKKEHMAGDYHFVLLFIKE